MKENYSILKYSAQLEFDKVLYLISELAVSQEAKKQILQLGPFDNAYDAGFALSRCDAVRGMLARHSAPGCSDVSGIGEAVFRAEKGGQLNMAELLRIRVMLRNCRLLLSWYSPPEGLEQYTDSLFCMLFADEALENDIGRAILSETEMSDDASAELASIRKRILREQESIRSRLESIVRSSDNSKILQESVVTMRGGRFVVPVKNEHRSALKGLIHDVSSSGSTLFVEPTEVVEANNRIMQLRGDEAAEIEKILYRFSARVAEEAEYIKNGCAAFYEVDAQIAKARYAERIKAASPQMNDDGVIELRRARHPLIDKNKVVPVDVSLGDDYDTLVITGPNTGGKTVTIKTLGLFTLMAMCGLPVPAAEGSRLSTFDEVLVDIGDEQSIEQNLSTFSAHMKNISSILKLAGPRSLALLDELGAGTDPAEGAALAVAILERLHSLKSKVAATTHYGEIKVYALETESVQNASCEFDIETLSPTYRVSVGLPGSSNALLIGERLGLDRELLDSAREHMSEDRGHMEDLLGEIEKLKSAASKKQEEAENALLEARDELARAETEREKLIKQAADELAAVQRRARELSADVTAEAYRLLDEIKKLDTDKKSAQRAREIANRESMKLYSMAPEAKDDMTKYEPATDLRPGALVYVPDIHGTAEVLSGPDDKGLVEIRAGAIKSRVSSGSLMKPSAAQSGAAKGKKHGNTFANIGDKKSGKSEINLLGMTTEEAVMEAETFIDAAVLSHMTTVYIIHGRGTGALRKAIQASLKTNRHVKSFRLGRYGEGEDGVTIAELK